MKKLLSIVLALSLCLTAMMGCFVVSAETAAIVVAGNTVAPGQDATVTVTGTNFDAVCAADLVITLPADFELVSITNDGEPLYKDGSAEAEENGPDYYYNETANTVKYVDVFNFQSETKPLALVLVVKTPADAEDKAYDVTAAVVAGDDEENFVYPAITNGAITLKTPCAHTEVTYTDNGDGTHTSACANEACTGGFVPATEPHDYGETGTCVCGAEEVVEIEKFDFYASNITLGNALVMNFAVEKTFVDALNDADCYAIVTKKYGDGRDDTTKIIPKSEFGTSGKYYTMSSDGIPAKEMGDDIHVVIYDSNDNAVSNTKIDSVEKYVLRTFATQKEIAKPMLVDMLKYGAASQTELEYNVTDLCDADLTEEQLAYATETAQMTDNSVKGTYYFASNLSLKSEIQLNIAFNTLPSTVAYAKVTYTGWNGGDPVVKTINAADFTKSGSKIVFKVDTLRVADGCQVVSVDLYDANDTLVDSAKDSVESYCARNSKSSDDFYATVMKFVSSSYYYLKNK